MKYAFSALALAAFAMADVATILSDISAIKTDTAALTAALTAGDVPTILSSSSKINDDLTKATTDAKATSQLSTSDAMSIFSAVTGLTSGVKDSIDATIKEFPGDSPLASAASSTLQMIQQNTDAFAAALIAISPAELQCPALQQGYSVDQYFSSGLSVYGTQLAITSPTCTASGSGSSETGSSSPATSSAEATTSASATSAAATTMETSAVATPTATGTTPAVTSAPATFTGAANANSAAGMLLACGLAAAMF